MVAITFPDRETAKKAVGFLLGRLSGRLLKSGECIVPEAAVGALADQNMPFTVKRYAIRSSSPQQRTNPLSDLGRLDWVFTQRDV